MGNIAEECPQQLIAQWILFTRGSYVSALFPLHT